MSSEDMSLKGSKRHVSKTRQDVSDMLARHVKDIIDVRVLMWHEMSCLHDMSRHVSNMLARLKDGHVLGCAHKNMHALEKTMMHWNKCTVDTLHWFYHHHWGCSSAHCHCKMTLKRRQQVLVAIFVVVVLLSLILSTTLFVHLNHCHFCYL